jgi:hypothetical protein
MIFQEEVKTLSDISTRFLQKLEAEPVYVKKYIEEVCQKIKEGGWVEKEGERPWVKTFERQKYTLKIALVHARKGEHVTGADLLFQLKDKKMVFVQSKKVGAGDRIHFNRFQLQKLIELECQICGLFPFYSDIDIHEWIEIVHHFYHRFEKYYRLKYFPFVPVLPFLPIYYLPFRAAFYHLIMTNPQQIETRFIHTSEIFFTLGSSKSLSQKEFLSQGLKPDEFYEMFWECKIGGPDIKEDIKKEVLYFYSLLTNRLIIWLDIEKK